MVGNVKPNPKPGERFGEWSVDNDRESEPKSQALPVLLMQVAPWPSGAELRLKDTRI